MSVPAMALITDSPPPPPSLHPVPKPTGVLLCAEPKVSLGASQIAISPQVLRILRTIM